MSAADGLYYQQAEGGQRWKPEYTSDHTYRSSPTHTVPGSDEDVKLCEEFCKEALERELTDRSDYHEYRVV